MQSVQGKPAGAPVSSELAAMFAFAVIPTIRKHYYDPAKGMGELQYKNKCKAFAQRIGLPPDEWPRVTLPCFISFDWDTRHTYVREYLASERVPDPVLAQVDNDAIVEHLGREYAPPLPPRTGPASAINLTLLAQPVCPKKRPHERPNMLYATEVRDHADRRANGLARHKEVTGEDLILMARWKAALKDTRYITVDKRQYMPLSKVSPDIHSPVEHLVGTVKKCVRNAMLGCDLSDAQLWKGKTYQRFINNAVSTSGNGADGQHHIGGSVKKQILICQILAAEKTEWLTLDHQFEGYKKTIHTMYGTAGAWIRVKRWT